MAMSRVLFFFIISVISVQSIRFSAPFYHRDSPFSPFYNPTLSETELLMRSVNRSLTRANRVSLDFSIPTSDVYADEGEYLMNVSLGTPPFDVALVVDTGSDPLWTLCLPRQNQARLESNKASPSQEISYYQIKPLFDPTKSSTYKEFSCASDSDGCPFNMFGSCNEQRQCVYNVHYGDGSFTDGRIASETLTIGTGNGKLFVSPNFIFGCGFDNSGTFSSYTTGVIGLGGGPRSLVSQLSSKIRGQFSYCLPSFTQGKQYPGIINFGENLVDYTTVMTPLVDKKPTSFRFVTLNSFTIGDQKVKFIGSSGSVEKGNIVIDTGTPISRIAADFYDKISRALSSQMTASPVKSPYSRLSLCYADDDTFRPPELTANFAGADVRLTKDNFFVKMGRFLCLGFIVKSKGVPIYGNVAQSNFLIGFDLVRKTVSFKNDDCRP